MLYAVKDSYCVAPLLHKATYLVTRTKRNIEETLIWQTFVCEIVFNYRTLFSHSVHCKDK